MDKNATELLAEINNKLDKVIVLLATQGRSEDEQIVVLRGLDYEWSLIGTIVGLTATAAKKRYQRRS